MVTWLGVKFDLGRSELSIPQDKITEYEKWLAASATKTTCILGYLNHVSKVVRAAPMCWNYCIKDGMNLLLKLKV